MCEQITVKSSGAKIEVYETGQPSKGAVVICPGGGYQNLSWREAGPVANALVKAGYLAVVLYYEVKKIPLGNLPLQQLSDTVCFVRNREIEWNLSEKPVYVCGFSAGGHLAASLGILWKKAEYFRPGTDLKKHRPDGMILGYPVISSGMYAHRGSFEHLVGPDEKEWETYSLEKLVDETCVPTFLWGTFTDKSVPVENSLLLLGQLAKYKISTEYHLFPEGVHGLSLATEEVADYEKNRCPDSHVAGWMKLCLEWLDQVMAENKCEISEKE